MASPFTFGTQPTSSTQTATSQFSFGTPAKTTAPTLSLTNPSAPTNTGGFNFGLNKTTASTNAFGTPAATTATTGFGGFGLTQPAAAATTTTTNTGFGGFGLNQAAAVTTSTTTGFSGFGLNQATSTTTAATTGFSFNTTAPTSTAAATGFGFNLSKPAATTATGFGQSLLGSAPTTSAPSLGLGGGLFSTSGTTSTAAPSIFSTVATASTSTGLGGLDPNTALKQGAGDGASSSSDGKTLKESILPDPLAATVDSLQKFVKEEKTVREDIARMSSKPMMKVQEDVTALKQLLAVVANGLQRNACAVDKLKQEMTQKLKNAEMAQRTKDIPAGLQYENTAPTEYFQRLVEEFEDRMVMYRQQIESLDSHLAALHQPSPHTPAEVLALLKKLHETFISLAAQLQIVHEAVKAQKDQFVTYRRVFHGDSKNIFHKSSPAPTKAVTSKQLADLAGPTPFPMNTNAAAHAMAMVHARSQQPQGPPVTGLGMGAATGMVGPTFPSTTGIFGPKPTQGVSGSLRGVGSLFSTSLSEFGTPATQGSSTTAALNLASTNLSMAPNAKPFQLQKPPQGAKRGKR